MSAYSDAVLADTPVGYWRLGEASGDCADSSGNSYTAVAHGTGPTYGVASAIASDAANKAITGTYNQNCIVTTETGGSLQFGTGDFTVECWMKVGASGTNAFAAVYKGGESGVSGWRVGLDTADKVKILLGDTDSYREGNVSNAIADVTIWHHIVVAFDRDGNAIGYLDGSATGVNYSISARSKTVDSATGVHLGWVNVSGKTVSVDEVAVYTGLLSSARIAAHYAAATAATTTFIPGIMQAHIIPSQIGG